MKLDQTLNRSRTWTFSAPSLHDVTGVQNYGSSPNRYEHDLSRDKPHIRSEVSIGYTDESTQGPKINKGSTNTMKCCKTLRRTERLKLISTHRISIEKLQAGMHFDKDRFIHRVCVCAKSAFVSIRHSRCCTRSLEAAEYNCALIYGDAVPTAEARPLAIVAALFDLLTDRAHQRGPAQRPHCRQGEPD